MPYLLHDFVISLALCLGWNVRENYVAFISEISLTQRIEHLENFALYPIHGQTTTCEISVHAAEVMQPIGFCEYGLYPARIYQRRSQL